MELSRIASGLLINRGTSNIRTSMLQIAQLQEQIATGKKLNHASDDPVGLTQLMKLNTESSNDEDYVKNINQGIAELTATENAFTGIKAIADRAYELSVQASNITQGTTNLNAIAQELQTLIDRLVQLGNTKYGDKYILSGYATDTPPFVVAGQDITYQGTPLTDPYQREVQIARNTTVPINFNGDSVLGNVTVTIGPPDTAAGNGLLYNLTQLKLDLTNQPTDYDAIRNNVDVIKASTNTLLTQHTQIGAWMNQLELAKERIESDEIVRTRQREVVESADLAKVISDLSFKQNTYQASLGALGRILDTSIMNFIR